MRLELARARRAAQVDADDGVPAAERVADAVPERARETEAVHEDDGRPVPRHLDVQLGAADLEQLPGRRRLESTGRRRSFHLSSDQPRALTASTIAATVGA